MNSHACMHKLTPSQAPERSCVAWRPSGGLSEDRYGLVIKSCGRVSSTATANVWRVDRDCSLYRLVDEPVLQAAFFKQLDDADLIEVLH